MGENTSQSDHILCPRLVGEPRTTALTSSYRAITQIINHIAYLQEGRETPSLANQTDDYSKKVFHLLLMIYFLKGEEQSLQQQIVHAESLPISRGKRPILNASCTPKSRVRNQILMSEANMQPTSLSVIFQGKKEIKWNTQVFQIGMSSKSQMVHA